MTLRPFLLAAALSGGLLVVPSRPQARPNSPSPPSAASVDAMLAESRNQEDSNPAKADAAGRRALELARQGSDRPTLLRALLQSAHAARAAGDYLYTLDAVSKGLNLADSLHDSRTRAALLQVRGTAQWNRASRVEATLSFVESLRIADSLVDKKLLLAGHSGLGLVCSRSDDADGALFHFNSALHLAQELKDEPRIASILHSRGNLYLEQKSYGPAREDFEQALTLSRASKDQRSIAFLLLNLGRIATETGDQTLARRYLTDSLAICEDAKIEHGLAEVHCLLAAVDRRADNLEDSVKHLQQASLLAEKLKDPDLFIAIYEQQALTQEQRGDFRSALDYQRKFAAEKEIVRGDKIRRQADEIQARYQAESRSRQFKLLQRDQELQQADVALKNADLNRAHSQRYALVALFALSAAAVSGLISRLGVRMVRTRRMLVETQAAKQQVEAADALKARLLDAAAIELSDSETRFRTAFEHSALGLALVSPEGKWLSVNNALCAIVGYTAAELTNISFREITHPDDLQADLDLVTRVLRGEIDSYHLEKRYFHKDGRLVWVALDTSLVRDSAKGQPRYFISQVCDITASKEAGENLRAAKEEAERANNAKSEFLSRMSHELRTPLNAILGFSQLLSNQDLGRRPNESVSHILTAGRHLLGLIDEVLDLAKIESGRLEITDQSCSVAAIAVESLELIQPLAVQAGVRLLPAVSDFKCHVAADPRRLKQILLNLLSNAIKYNRPDGEVALRWRRAGGRLRIEVADTGPGIPTADLEKIGRPFSRLAATEAVPGTGLGLSLTRALTEAMSGIFGFSSEVGVGSTFWVELPASEPPTVHSEPPIALGPSVFEDEACSSGESVLLYIEDNLANLQLMEHLFEQRDGIRLIAAMQGSLGLELAREHRPDLILLDLHLPDMSGEAVLRELRSLEATAEIPVIVISADATPKRQERVKAMGARHYLTKPFDVAELRSAIHEALEASAAAPA